MYNYTVPLSTGLENCYVIVMCPHPFHKAGHRISMRGRICWSNEFAATAYLRVNTPGGIVRGDAGSQGLNVPGTVDAT